MINEQVVTQIREELKIYTKLLAQASQTVLDQDVSNYPIFVVAKTPMEIGIPIVNKLASSSWLINISTLEEFVAKQIIQSAKVEEFKSVYKEPTDFFCLFVHDGKQAQFIFMPYFSEWQN